MNDSVAVYIIMPIMRLSCQYQVITLASILIVGCCTYYNKQQKYYAP